MHNPLVSVVIPCFNSEAFILETLSSVTRQSMTDFEIIVVDDCSTDRSMDVVKGIADKRIRLIELSANVGPAEARNVGLRLVRGQFVALLDGDDLWHREKLKRQLAAHRQTGAAFTYTRYDVVDEAGKPYANSGALPKAARRKTLLPHCFIRTSSVMYERSRLENTVEFPPLRKRQDFGFFILLLDQLKEAYLVDDELCSYRTSPNSVSSKKLSNIKYQWQVYRQVAKLTRTQTSIVMAYWFVRSGLIVAKRKALEITTRSGDANATNRA